MSNHSSVFGMILERWSPRALRVLLCGVGLVCAMGAGATPKSHKVKPMDDMKTLEERFLRYVSVDTQSDPQSDSYPSTTGQRVLLSQLADELRSMGLEDVVMDEYGYVMATVPASHGLEKAPVIGLIAHVDTSPDMKGSNVSPRVIDGYEGGDIALNDSLMMRVNDFPLLEAFKGHRLIVTDGTTLLGADDKAGVAEIMTLVERLTLDPGIRHGKLRIAFTPDEEVGRGVDHFDVERFGAQFAYTVDGGMEGELEFENFNAASVHIEVQGRNIHPGAAKGKMINALEVLCQFDGMLPLSERPETTEGYEGFYHPVAMNGTVEHATADYILRDHSRKRFAQRKATIRGVADSLNGRYGADVVRLMLKDQYYNMREKVEPYPQLIERAKEAMRRAGVEPQIGPIRGGTDGAQLSFRGLPCPNLFTGGMNFHGKFEYCSVTVMQRAVETLCNLVQLWAVDDNQPVK